MHGGGGTSSVSDAAAELQRRVRELSKLYEQHAYLLYNLALRTTCEPESAVRAAERAFLQQALRDGGQQRLVAASVAVALTEASATPDPHGAGDAGAEAMLAAAATLEPAERAALALRWLADADAHAVGQAMGIGEAAASELVDRGAQRLASALGVDLAELDHHGADWLWAPPPAELWERIYPRLHRALEREALAPSSAIVRRMTAPLRVARPLLGRRGVAVLLGLVAAGVAAAALSLRDSGSGAAPTPAPLVDTDRDYRPNPRALPAPRAPARGSSVRETLRRANALRKSRRRARSTAAARRRAAAQRQRRAGELRSRAVERYNASRRRRARELDREARRRARERAQASPPPTADPKPTKAPPRSPPGTPPTPQEAQERCLFNADTGTYICPN
jgi:hypothetical protein